MNPSEEKAHHHCHGHDSKHSHEHEHGHHHHHVEFDEKKTIFYVDHIETRTFTLAYQLLMLIDITNASNILEVGCGAGKLALEMAMQKKPDTSLTVTDYSEFMVKITKGKFEKFGFPFKNMNIEQADGCALKYENESFDRYLSNLTIHHAGNVENFVKEAFRVLKKQGICAISEFGREEMCDSVKIMKSSMEKAGLEIGKMAEIFPFLRLPKEFSFFKDLFEKSGFADVKIFHSSMVANVTSGEDYVKNMVGMSREKLIKLFGEDKTHILLNFCKEECDRILKENVVLRDESIIVLAKKI